MEVETVGAPPRSPRTPFTHLFTPHAALAWFCFQWLALMNSAYWASLGLLFSEQYVCEYEAQLLCVQFRYISEFPVGSSWGYPPWDFIWNTSLRGLPPCSPFLAPFLICLGSSFLINHLLINPHLRVCLLGTWPRILILHSQHSSEYIHNSMKIY